MTLTRADASLDLLADVAASFAKPDPDRIRRLRDDGGATDREMWARLADNGWLGITVDEDLGGAGLGLDAVAIVARRLGYGCFPEPFVAAGVLAPELLAAAAAHGATEDEDRLAAAISGELLVGAGWRAEEVAVDTSAGPMLSGSSRFTGVSGADAYVVAARAGEPGSGAGLYWVTGEARGLTVVEERRADGSVSEALIFESVEAEELVPAGAGGEILDRALDAARLAVAAELAGIGQRALELTLGYLRERVQFGSPIGSFQALQHRAVDIWVELQLTDAALEAAVAVHLDREPAPNELAAAASSAKARAAIAVPRICKEALQLHGAIGFTDEYELGLYLNRALALAPWLGSATEHTRRWDELTRPEGRR